MPQQNHNKHQAFTLVEMLLVLLLLITVILVGRSQYEKYVLRKDIAVVEQNLQLLFDQLDRSFYELSDAEKASCSSKINNSIITDWSQILSSSLISDITVGTVTHPDFTVSCVDPETNQPAQLVITAPLTVKLDQMDWYAQRLRAIRDGNNNTVKWSKIPTYMFAGKDPFWVLAGQLSQFKEKMKVPTSDFIVTANVPSVGTSKPVRIVVSYVYEGKNATVELNTSGNSAPQEKLTFFLEKGLDKYLDISDISIYCLNGGDKVFSHSAVNNLPLKSGIPLLVNFGIYFELNTFGEMYTWATYSDNAGHSGNFPEDYYYWPCP